MEKLATDPEVQEMLKDILEQNLAKRKREELSATSFKEWVYNALRMIFANMGYQLQSFEDFWKDVKINIVNGWKDGRDYARREAERKREIRERRYH